VTAHTTVTIPAWNAEDTLREAVASALAQTVGDLEVLVVDDGSRIPAAEVLADIDDPRLRVVRHETNRGLSAARNTAIAEVHTPLFSQLDADDLWEPEYLESVLPLFGDPEVGLAYTDAVIFHADGREQPYLTSHLDHPVDTFPALTQINPIAALTVTARTDAVRAVGGYSTRLWGGQDWRLYLELAAAGWRFAYVDRPLARYRWPEDHGGMSADLRKVMATNVQLLAGFKLRHPLVPGPGRRAAYFALRLARDRVRRAPPAPPAAPAPDAAAGRPRLKVVTLVAELSRFGGAEHVALEMTRGLDPARFDRTLAVTRWTAAAAAEHWVPASLAALERAGVRFLGLNRASALHVWAWLPLIRFLRRERVDILHTHQFGSNVSGVLVGRLARVPVIVAHEHSWSYVGQPVRRVLDRWVIAALADVLVAVSSADRRRMREVEHIPDRDTALLPNGIGEDPVAVTPGDVRAELGIDAGQLVVGSVSTLRPEKRVDVLVRAAPTLAARVPGVRILVAGRGSEQAPLEALIAELGVGGTVTLLGQRTDIPDFLAALDVAVCSSEREGSP
jgi:glycosyltransferase involved in cell wall biosynthesis